MRLHFHFPGFIWSPIHFSLLKICFVKKLPFQYTIFLGETLGIGFFSGTCIKYFIVSFMQKIHQFVWDDRGGITEINRSQWLRAKQMEGESQVGRD